VKDLVAEKTLKLLFGVNFRIILQDAKKGEIG